MRKNTLTLNIGKKRLSLLVQSAGDFVRIEDAEKTLSYPEPSQPSFYLNGQVRAGLDG